MSSLFLQYSLTAAPLTLKELTIQGHHLREETSTRAREADSLRNQPTGTARKQVRVRQFIYFYFLQSFFPTRLSLLAVWQTPLTLASSLSLSLPLSYGVSERQRSFAPLRELQASVTLSYTRHVKPGTELTVIDLCKIRSNVGVFIPPSWWLLHLESKSCWFERKKIWHNQWLTSSPPPPLSLQSSREWITGQRGSQRERKDVMFEEVLIAWSYAAYRTNV